MTTIAIPHAADTHRYSLLWKYFFENLGFNVILSPDTTKAIVDAGVKEANTDMCFAMKLYYGHVLELMKKKFDYLFVPSIIGSSKTKTGDYCCAYFAALPDMIKSSFNVKILTETFYADNDSYEPYISMAKQLGISDEDKARHAFDLSVERWKAEKEKEKDERDEISKQGGKSAKKIAFIGPDYVILDTYCRMNIPEMLRDNNYEVVYSSDIPQKALEKAAARFQSRMHWHSEKEVVGAIYHFADDKSISGIIVIFPFSCGPCFLVHEQVVSKIQGKKKFLMLNIDESQNEARIKTRIEAFLDILEKN